MAEGAPFAVLVAEQLATSGADLVISVTSASQITQLADVDVVPGRVPAERPKGRPRLDEAHRDPRTRVETPTPPSASERACTWMPTSTLPPASG